MIKPTAQQVKEYAEYLNYEIDAEAFLDYYDIVGWVYGKNRTPITSWKACVRTWKRRAEKTQQAEAALKRAFRPPYEPTVFVQCVKGPTTGRYLPIILGGAHWEDIPHEQYVAAAEVMCKKLSLADGTEWVVREGATERLLMRERAAAAASRKDSQEKPKRGNPRSMSREIRKQIKEIKKNLKF